MIDKIKKTIYSNKILSLFIFSFLTITIYYGYSKIYSDEGEIRYILAKVEKGTIISTVSGSGQVSAYDQLDIKPKTSGEVTWINMKVGQSVSYGQAIATIDSTEIKKNIVNSEISLEESKLNFDREVAQAPIDYDKKLETLNGLREDLEKKYEDSFNAISNTFLDLPSVISGLQNLLYGSEMDTQTKSWNIDAYKNLFDGEDRDLVTSLVDIAVRDYNFARTSYDKNFESFRSLTRYSNKLEVEDIVNQTLETTKLMSQSAKSQNNLLDTIIDIYDRKDTNVNSTITLFKSSLKSYLGTTNNHLSSLLSQKSSITDTKQSIINTERDIEISKINNPTGTNPISLQISLNSIKKKESDLSDLKATLADYTVRAPFDGILARVNIKKGDSVSSGTTMATIITKQKIAEITLNEVDVAKVKIDQKVTLTFDAIEDLTISGRVSEIETIGTVSQGVVTYNIKISFDTQDDRVKPGMSLSASIITEAKSDVVMIPSSAIKTQNNINYVELFESSLSGTDSAVGTQGVVSPTPPTQRNIEIGISNDTQTEVVSGLKEDEEIVIRTTTSTTNTTTSSSSIRIPGLGGGSRQGGSVSGAMIMR